ncbi:MAG: serine/threonine protein kinase, partial [Actinomycetia bacterium]|nr:serine/threonine protein kinase [Actinomycetes bacterium]
MNGASLAACQKNAIAPTRVAIAIHVVCEAASAVHAAHAMQGNAAPAITPENIRVRYDATVELIGAPPPTGAEATRSGSAYLAPEQVAGGAVVDLRANVFSLGVVLWELLTATNLFARDTPAATRTAIIEDPVLDVRDVNPDVPVIVGEVLATALQREPTARFETPQAFCTALKAARDASALAAA